MSTLGRILVIGGTRGTGRLIVERLVDARRPVRALARDPLRARADLPTACEIVAGDVTKPETLPPALSGVSHIVFTAGMRSGRPTTERNIRATEYEGVRHMLDAAKGLGFNGRFLYMTAGGVVRPSLATVALNLYKGNTLVWRLRAEQAIRESRVDYTVIRAGFLLNRPGGQHAIVVTQSPLRLSLWYRIARADVADAFVAALDHPRASRATFEVVWGKGRPTKTWPALLDDLEPDAGET